MKKLMILTTAIVLAAVTQAASVYWTATNVYAGNDTDLATGIAYYMVTTVAETSAWKAGLTVDECKALVGNSYSYTPAEAGRYTIGSSAAVSNTDLGLSDSTAYRAYLVVFDGATIDASKSFYVSNTKDFTTQSGNFSANSAFSNQKTASQNPDNWTAMAPEPTSGLLLLMGMGVLALRRKQK